MAALNEIQLELLRLFGNNVSDETLAEVKRVLVEHFSRTASDQMDEFMEAQGLTDIDMKNWALEHNRLEDRRRH